MNKFKKVTSILLVIFLFVSIFTGIIPKWMFKSSIAFAEDYQITPLLIDDFSTVDNFVPDASGVKGVNKLNGNYYGDGTQYCDGTMLKVYGSDTTWINMNLSNKYPADLDATPYSDLVFVVKGDSSSDKVVITLSDGNNKTGTPYTLNLTTDWKTLKIPLSTLGSSELDLTKLNQIRFSQFSGNLYIDEMRLVSSATVGGGTKTKIVADFNDASKYTYSGQQHDDQYGFKGTNDLGGRLTSSGIQTCSGGILSVDADTTWLCFDLSSNWPANFDSSPYTNLVFVARGASDGIKIDVDFTNGSSVHSSKQTITLTTEMKTYKVPLSGFTGVDMTKLNQIYTSGFNGEFEIDEIRFEGQAVSQVLVDDFNDASKYTKTYSSTFNGDRGTIKLGGKYYGDGIQVADGTMLSLEYTTNWYTTLLDDQSKPLDVTSYSHLVYNIKGLENTSMNVALSYKNSSGNETVTNYVNVPITTSWQKVKIPLSAFSGLDKAKLMSIRHTFTNGLIYIDNISFEYDPDNASDNKVITASSMGPGTSWNTTDMDFPPAAPEGTEHTLVYKDAPVNNPLKGFMPFTKNEQYDPSTINGYPFENIAHSMEWFYLPLSSTMTGMNSYDFSYLEKMLNQIAGTGRQAVFRFYLDYPDKPSGIPQFLLDMGLVTHSYTDYNNGTHYASVVPDYNDPNLEQALQNFIAEFGKRYDGDPRIGFIDVGIVGFWGEWHTYPYDGYEKATDGVTTLPDWMPSAENQSKILHAFDNAFSKTKVLLRYPMADSPSLDLGYHDDSFAWESLDATDDPVNGQSWMTMGRLKSAGVENYWKVNPVGGEIRPEIQTKIWSHEEPVFQYPADDPQNTLGLGRNSQDFYTCLDRLHASWLTQHMIFTNPLTVEEKSRVMEAQKNMGYILHVPKSYINDVTLGSRLKVGIEMENKGVAPFYYNAASNWPVQIGLKSGNKIVKTWDTTWDITKVLPGDRKVFTWSTSDLDILSKNYDVVMRIKNPLSDVVGDKALKVLFANEEQGEDGWLKLASVNIETPYKQSSPGSPASGNSNNGDEKQGTVSTDGSGNVQVSVVPPAAPDASGTAAVSVSKDLLSQALDQSKADAENVKTVEIAIPKVDGALAYKLELPASFLISSAGVASTNKFEIKSDIATLIVPDNMLTSADIGATQNVALTIATADKTKLSPELQAQIGNRPLIELNLSINGSVKTWSNPDTPVTLAVPYKPTDAELADPEHIVVWYIDGTGKAIPIPTGRYDAATGKVVFTTTHFSAYAVAYVNKTFTDIANYTWAKKAIEVMASKGIINATSANNYTPSAPVKRADFILLLVKTLGLSAKVDSNFSDVNPSTYYAEAVAIAKKLGITNGVGNNKFTPEAQISRQDMMVMINRAMTAAKKNLMTGTESDLSSFEDRSKVASYAIQSVATLVKNGIVKGDGANINPLKNVTRAETAVLLYHIFNK